MAIKNAFNSSSVLAEPLQKLPNTFANRVSPYRTKQENPATLNKKLKISITLDHLQTNNGYSVLDAATWLSGKNIPVTVFVECLGGPGNDCTAKDKTLIDNLAKLKGVELGVHTLPTVAIPAKNVKKASKKQQTDNINYISEAIKKATGKYPRVASYHGKNAGPDSESIIRPCNIKFVRGTTTTLNPKKFNNTPVIANVLGTFHNSILANNSKKLQISVFFFHPNEIMDKASNRDVIDALIEGIKKGIYEAIPYFNAMRLNFPGKDISPKSCEN